MTAVLDAAERLPDEGTPLDRMLTEEVERLAHDAHQNETTRRRARALAVRRRAADGIAS